MKHHVLLASGYQMPLLGMGTWQWQPDHERLEAAIDIALECGYRAFDTAYSYQNEQVVGRVLKRWLDSGRVKREDIFVTTKLSLIFKQSAEEVRRACQLSLRSLQLDYIDLYLNHAPWAYKYIDDNTPYPVGSDLTLLFTPSDIVQEWRWMESLVDAGLVRSIGVSNFNSEQVDRVCKAARYPVANNQVECHAYLRQAELRRFCQERNITVTAFQPLGDPGRPTKNLFGGIDEEFKESPLKDPIVKDIAAAKNKTPAQVLLKHLVQSGVSVVPKSVTPQHIKENIQIFDFALSEEEMINLDSLDRGLRYSEFDAMKGQPEYPFSIPF